VLGITFRQLQVFVEVVDIGSFRACAERLGVRQVSVSDHIRSLERQIGRSLFERRRGATASLTEDGRQAYRHAVTLLAQIDSFVETFSSIHDERPRRRLIIAAPDYVSFRLAQVFAEFGSRHPQWQVEIEPTDAESATEAIAHGKADIGFILALEGAAPAGSALIWRERLGLYAGREHPLAGRRRVAPAELSTWPFIYLPKKYPLRGVVEAVLEKSGIAGNPIAVQTDNPVLARRTLMQGKAIGCLFAHTVKADVEKGDLVELPLARNETLVVEVRLVTSPGTLARRASRALIDLAEGSRDTNFNLD
jgi:LysR family transcriptional regulator, transcriptional activator of the cysJI operon